jgi:hypothetical protein
MATTGASVVSGGTEEKCQYSPSQYTCTTSIHDFRAFSIGYSELYALRPMHV